MGKILRLKPDSAYAAVILSSGVDGCQDAAIDLTNDKIYWTHYANQEIKRCDLDGGNSEVWLDTSTAGPVGITVNPGADEVYWYEYSPAKIRKAALDGTGATDVLTSGLAWISEMGIHPALGKLVLCDSTNNSIRTCDLDGTNLANIVTGITGTTDGPSVSVDIDNDKIYYSNGDQLRVCDMDGGNNALVYDIDTTGVNVIRLEYDPGDDYLYFTYDQADGDIYRVSIYGTGYEKLRDSDQDSLAKSWKAILYKPSTLVYQQTVVSTLDMDQLLQRAWERTVVHTIDVDDTLAFEHTNSGGYDVYTRHPSDDLDFTQDTSVWIDPHASERLFVMEWSEDECIRMDFDGNNRRAMFDTGNKPTDADIHVNRYEIYWVDITDNTIHRGNLDGTGETVILDDPAYSSLLSLCVDSYENYIYFVDESDTNNKVYRMDLDGSNITLILEATVDDVVRPYGLAAYNNQLYFCDYSAHIVKRCDYDGSNVTDLITGWNLPQAICIDRQNERIFFGRGISGGDIYVANIDGSGDTVLTDANLPDDLCYNEDNDTLYWTSGRDVKKTVVSTGITTTIHHGVFGKEYHGIDYFPFRNFIPRGMQSPLRLRHAATGETYIQGIGTSSLDWTSTAEAGFIITLNAPSGISVSDTLDYTGIFPRTLTSTITVSDVVGLNWILTLGPSSTITFVSVGDTTHVRSTSDSDSLDLSHDLDPTWILQLSGSSTIVCSDIATRIRIGSRTATNTIDISDTLDLLKAVSADSSGTLVISDNCVETTIWLRTPTHAIPLDDDLNVGYSLQRASSSTIDWVSVSAYAGVFNRTTSDTISASDVASFVQTVARTASDTVVLTSTASQLAVFARPVTTEIDLTSTGDRNIIVTYDLSDTITLTQAAIFDTTWVRSAVNALSLSHVLDAGWVLNKSLQDTLVLDSEADRLAVLGKSITSTLSISDLLEVNWAWPLASSSTLDISGTATQDTVWPRDASSTLDLDDTLARTALVSPSASSTLDLSDLSVLTVIWSLSSADDIDLTSTAAQTPIYLRPATDTMSLDDSADRIATVSHTASSTISLTGTASETSVLNLAASDTLVLDDDPDRLIVLNLSLTSTITLTSTGYEETEFTYSITHTLSISDAASRIATLQKDVSATLALSDTAGQDTVWPRSASGALLLSDDMSAGFVLTKDLSNTLVLTGTPDRIATVQKASSHTLDLTSIGDRNIVASKSATSVLVPSVSATQDTVWPRTASSIIDAVSQAALAFTLQKDVTDTLSLSNVASRVHVALRFSTSTLALTHSDTVLVVWDRALSSTIDLSDSLGRVATLGKSLLSSIDLDDAIDRVAIVQHSGTSTLIVTDISDGGKIVTATLSSTIVIGDDLDLGMVLGKSITDTLAPSDSASRVLVNVEAVTHNLSVSDTAAQLGIWVRSASNTLSMTYEVGVGYSLQRDVTSTLIFTEAVPYLIEALRGGTTVLSAAQEVAMESVRPRAATDSLIVSQQAAETSVLNFPFTSTLVFSSVAAQNRVRDESDSQDLDLSDSVAEATVFPRAGSDSMTLSDSLNLGFSLHFAAASAMDLSDDLSLLFILGKPLTSSLTLVGTAAFTQSIFGLFPDDTATVSDAADYDVVYPVSGANTLTGLDHTANTGYSLNKAMADSLIMGSTATRTFVADRSATSTLVPTSVASEIATLGLAATGSVSPSDAATVTTVYPRAGSHEIDLSASVGLLSARNEGLTNTLDLSQSASFNRTITRAASSTLTWQSRAWDSVLRNPDDTLTMGDEAIFSLVPFVFQKVYVFDDTNDKMFKMGLDGSNVEDVWTSGISEGQDVRLDLSSEKIYFTEPISGGIDRANIDGSGTVDTIITGLTNPQSVAVGPDKVYFAEINDGVYIADQDGSNINQLFTDAEVDDVKGLVVDEVNGKLYMACQGTSSIQKCDLDGSNRSTVVSSLGTLGRITIDFNDGHLYYFDHSDDKIYQVTTAGTGNTAILTVGETVYDMTYNPVNNKLYYTTSNEVYAVDDDGSNNTAIYTDLLADGIRGLDVHWRVQVWFRSASSAIDLSHEIGLLRSTVESGSGTLTISDEATAAMVRVRSLTNELAMSDSATRTAILNLNVVSAIAALHDLDRLIVVTKPVSDTLTISDSSTFDQIAVRSASDTLTISDDVSLNMVLGKSITSTLTLTSVAEETQVLPLSASNSFDPDHSLNLGFSLRRDGVSTLVPAQVATFDAIFDRYASNTGDLSGDGDRNIVVTLSASNTLTASSSSDKNFVLNLAAENLLAVNQIADHGQRYWIKSTTAYWGNTDAWAYSSGGPGIAPVPTIDDDVHFDSNGTGTCRINIDVSARSWNLHSGFTGVVTVSAADKTITIGDSTTELGLIMDDGTLEMGATATWNVYGGWDVEDGTQTYETATLNLYGTGSMAMTTNQYLYRLYVHDTAEITMPTAVRVTNRIDIDGTIHNENYFAAWQACKMYINSGSVIDGIGRLYFYDTQSGGGLLALDGSVTQTEIYILVPTNTAVFVAGIYPADVRICNHTASLQEFKPSAGTYTFQKKVTMKTDSTGDMHWDNSNSPDINFQGDFEQAIGSTGVPTWTKGSGTIGIAGGNTQVLDFDSFSMEEIVMAKSGTNVASITGTFTTEYLMLVTGYWDFGDADITCTGDFTADNADINWGSGNIIIGGHCDWEDVPAYTRGTSQTKLTGTSKNLSMGGRVYSLWVTGSYTTVGGTNIGVQDGDLIVDGTLTAGNTTGLWAWWDSKVQINTGGTINGTTGLTCYRSQNGGGLTVLDGTLSPTTFFIRESYSTGVFVGGTWDCIVYLFGQGADAEIRLNNETYTITGPVYFQSYDGYTTLMNNAINNPSFILHHNFIALWVDGGTLTWTKGTGFITLASGGSQTFSMEDIPTQTVEDIYITSGSTVTLNSNIKTDALLVQAGTTLNINGKTLQTLGYFQVSNGGALTVAGLNGCTITVGGQLRLYGASGDKLDLGATATWYLNVTDPTTIVQHVTVKNSDASGGVTIHSTNSINEGNNINWAFDGLYWTNGASTGLVNDYRNWGSESGVVDNAGVPGLLDTPIWDGSVTDTCTLDLHWSVAGADMQAGFTGKIDGATYNFTSSGDCDFDGGEVDFGTGTWQFGGYADFINVTTITKGTATIKMVTAGKTLSLQTTDTFCDIWIAANTTIVASASGACEGLDVDATLTVNTGSILATRGVVDVSGTITGTGTMVVYAGGIGEGITGMSGTIDIATLFVYVTVGTAGIVPMVAAQYDSALTYIGSQVTGGEFNFAATTTTFTGNVSLVALDGGDTAHFKNSTNNPSLVFQGNVNKTGAGSTSWTTGSGTITFSGTTADQQVAFDGNSVEDIIMNKGAGKVTLTAALSCESLALNDGDWDANDYNVTVSGNVNLDNDSILMGDGNTWEVNGSWDSKDLAIGAGRETATLKMTGTGVTLNMMYASGVYSLWFASGCSVTIDDNTKGGHVHNGILTVDGTVSMGSGCSLQLFAYTTGKLRVNTTGYVTGAAGQLWVRDASEGAGIDVMDGVVDCLWIILEKWLSTGVMVGGIYNAVGVQIRSSNSYDCTFKFSDDTYVFDGATGVQLRALNGWDMAIDNTNGARIILPDGGISINETGGGVVSWVEE